MKVSKKRMAAVIDARNAAHVILQSRGYAAHTISKGKPVPHREAVVPGCTLRRHDLENGGHVLNISSDSVNYMNVLWEKSGGRAYATRFVPGPWEQTIRDAAAAIDPNWPKWAGLCFIDFEALLLTEEDIARRLPPTLH